MSDTTNNIRVLLIDPHPRIREVYSHLGNGFAVTAFENFEDAGRAIASGTRFDVILSEIHNPTDGTCADDAIINFLCARKSSGTPVLVCTFFSPGELSDTQTKKLNQNQIPVIMKGHDFSGLLNKLRTLAGSAPATASFPEKPRTMPSATPRKPTVKTG